MKKGRTILRDPAKIRIRALMMLEHQIRHSASRATIAKEFNVSINTVDRTLSWAKKADLLTKVEDKVLQELVPAAHKAILKALSDEDNPQKAGKLAIDVFKGMVPGFTKVSKGDASPTDPTGELARYVEQLRSDLGVLDGELEGDPLSLEPAASEAEALPGLLALPAGQPSSEGPDPGPTS